MEVGIIDVDCHAGKKKWGATMYPNLALCKVVSFHKAKGDDVEWAIPFKHYDIIYKAKIFNFSKDDDRTYFADKIVCGGTGYDLHSHLPQEIDDCQPDYSLYTYLNTDTAYGFLTRGCPNKCKWCVVPIKEGAIRPYWDIERVLNGKSKAVLMDNNILAAGDWCREQLDKIIRLGCSVDFNQALDARLVNEDNAKQLARIKWIDRRIRFGCDTHAQIAECERAIKMISDYGYTGEFFLYTMLHGTFEECFERINYWRERNLEVRRTKAGNMVYPYAQPYRDPQGVNVPPMWQKDMAQWCNKHQLFHIVRFEDFSPRKGFVCKSYFK